MERTDQAYSKLEIWVSIMRQISGIVSHILMTPVQRARRVRALKFFGAFSLTILPYNSLGFGQTCPKYALVTEQGVPGSWGIPWTTCERSYGNRDHRIMVEVEISQPEIKKQILGSTKVSSCPCTSSTAIRRLQLHDSVVGKVKVVFNKGKARTRS